MDNSAPSQNNPQQNVSNMTQSATANGPNEQVQTENIQQINLQQTPVPQVPVNPVSGPSKEGGPVGQSIGNETSVIQTSEQEPVLSPEIQKVGVSVPPNAEHVTVEPEVSAAGVIPEKTAVPVQTVPSNNIQLPMTEEEAKQAIKTHPAVDAAYGFGIEVLKQLKRLHQGLFNKTP